MNLVLIILHTHRERESEKNRLDDYCSRGSINLIEPQLSSCQATDVTDVHQLFKLSVMHYWFLQKIQNEENPLGR